MTTPSESISLTMESLSANDIDLSDITALDATGESLALDDMLPTGQPEDALNEVTDEVTELPEADIKETKESCENAEKPGEDLESKVERLSKCNATMFRALVETRKGVAKEFAVAETRTRNLWKLYKALLERVRNRDSGNPTVGVAKMAKLQAENKHIRHLLKSTLEGMSKE